MSTSEKVRRMGQYVKDLADRVFWTYVQSVAGLATAAGFDVLSLSAWKVAAVASLPAGYTLVKGIIAGFVNDPNTATFIRNKTH